jgi:flagellum-specific peptidoglycan hydrolase FlgJ
MTTRESFARQAYAAAKDSSEQSGMPALVTVAQAALESSWGESQLSREAHNYFGIKAHGKHERVQMKTQEFRGGKGIETEAEFASYPSMLECFRCRDSILQHGAVYAGARAKRSDEMGFIEEIARHWATDPHYAEKLKAMLGEVKEMLQ